MWFDKRNESDKIMIEEELEKIIGRVALTEYKQASDRERDEIREWANKLQAMSDSDFVSDATSRILESARVSSWSGNWEGIHARASACYTEAKRRHKGKGHAEDCYGDNLYTMAFNRAYRSQGYTPGEPSPCICGRSEASR